MADIIVIGAGLIGASTAFALNRRGANVTLVDVHDEPGAGASYANGGMLTPSMADPWNAPGVWRDLLRWYGRDDAPMLLRTKALPSLAVWGAMFLLASGRRSFDRATALNVRLGLFSVDMMTHWRAQVQLDYNGEQNGTAKIYRDGASFEAGLKKAESMAALGVEYEALDAKTLTARQPALAPIESDLVGAVHFPSDESGDAQKFTKALVEAVQRRGAKTRWGAHVKKFVVRNGAVAGVILADGEVCEADKVVIAAGAHAGKLAAQAGIRLAVTPVKGYSLTFSGGSVRANDRLTIPIVDDALHAAVTPLGERIRVAGTAEFAGFDHKLEDARIANLRDILRTILPEQAAALEVGGAEPWAGFRPIHARGAPVIGPTKVKGLYLNAGHGHLGWTLAAGSGEALAQEMLDRKPTFDLEPYWP